ncbi:MAG: bifunctional dihydroorotate dehydrogenase B NAD binding subunit/NADPH-dependent glutamate synthase [Paludibacteraceae bacterium]|nr:bifunctional dihydroorotate dehydrogenase B NAD binding subunit/NADPH-dependent glutamate synthase [Paludibacteraceae bacterium]
MNKILSKQFFSENVCELVVEAPLIAKSRKAGHFVIVRVDANGERMPLTIADSDTDKGTITLVVQRIGVSSAKLCALNAGDSVADVVGPLGKATDIQRFGTVVCACGGVGAAPMLPIAKALHEAGNRVITVLAARTKELIILEPQLARYSDEVVIMTDDGSYGTKGLVTNGIETVILRETVNKVITIGPAIMMKFVALLTKKYNIPTEASLNTIMVDGTGMCGACRVSVAGKTRFVCVDGPEFDAHQVDFDEMLSRLGSYRQEEREAYEGYQQERGEQTDSPITRQSPANHPLITRNTQHTESIAEDATEADLCSDRDAEWRKQLRLSLKPKERVAIERVRMPELDPAYRATTLYEEVNQGLTPEMAFRESKRCLDCANPGCVQGCPVGIDIPGFIKQIEAGNPLAAYDIIKQSSSLPAVCGRVCPQEKQCEAQCIHHKMNSQPVAIGYLERFAADTALGVSGFRSQVSGDNRTIEPSNKRIAVVGSGPAGLTFAGDMVRYGYDVTVFEALHEIGGVLKYGIPEYRLPNRIVDQEIAALEKAGVHFVKDTIIGKTIAVEELQKTYAGIFVASGAGLPRFMNIPGENLTGVMSSNEYLTRVNLMGAAREETDTPVLHGKNVAVIGGGNTAMDAVRTAKRLGAEHAIIVYRRSEEEMPARVEEVKHAKEEGVEFMTLHNPLEYKADEKGRVCKAVLQVMTLGEPDASGRRSPVPVEGQTVELDVDMVIVAVGVSPNPIIPSSLKELAVTKKGTIEVSDNLQSSIPVLFAGGDIVRGGATVILAMSDGRKAAAAMNDYLNNAQ